MSKYYNDGPFTIEQWNTLIQDVNDILQNPPTGTDCEPIDVIAVVEDPHLWAEADIEEVRDKLIETCPEISFDTELKLWKQEIIDEIETEMDKAWCDCENAATATNYGTWGPFSFEAVAAGHIESHSGGALIQDPPCNALCGVTVYGEEIYTSTWYPCPDNNFDDIEYYYDIAFDNTYEYMKAIYGMFSLSKRITTKQKRVDGLVEEIDTLIEELEELCENDPNPDCGAALKAQICEKGQDARDYQDDLDDLKGQYDEKSGTKDAYFEAANTAAEVNWGLVNSLEERFPPDINFISEHIAPAVGTVPWYKWFNPGCPYLKVCDSEGNPPGCVEEDDCEPGDVDTSAPKYQSFVTGSRADNELWPMLYFYRWSMTPGTWVWEWQRLETRISPAGIPFIHGSTAECFLQKLSITYCEKLSHSLCNQHSWTHCIQPCSGAEVPACTWSEYQAMSTCWFLYYDCVGMPFPFTYDDCADPTGVQIAENEAAIQEPRKAMAILKHRGGITNKDFTEKQEHYWEVFDNWYDYHPEYDDRHEEYC